MKLQNHNNNLSLILTATCWSLWLSPVLAEDLPISDMPLFLSTAAAPNVFFEVDDSGSMEWEILTQQHWHFCAYNPAHATDENLQADEDCGHNVTNGRWSSYNYNSDGDFIAPGNYDYIFSNADNAYSMSCGNTLQICEANLSNNHGIQLDWRILSSDLNMLYYDPNVNYSPWAGPCLTDGTLCEDASFNSALSDPRQGSSGYTATKNLNNFVFEVWQDTRGYSGNRPRRGANANATNTSNGEVDLWDKHIRYTVTGNTVTVETIEYSPGSPTQSDPSGLGETITSTSTLSGPDCFNELFPGDDDQCRTISATRQNIANWYQYYRKRSYVAKSAIAAVVSENPNYRYGLSVINNYDSLFVQMPAADITSYTTHNRGMLADLFDLDWPTSSTPLRRGLERVGDYYDNELGNDFDDPIIGSCQKNYTILFTDGYWNGSDPSVNDADGDNISNTLADVARYYYDTDLSGFDNLVPADNFDNNPRQHMVTFGVAFGVKGNLEDTDDPSDGWPDNASGNNLAIDDDWGNPTNNNPAKIDDLWHAAYNSSGTYVSASTATEVVNALQNALQSIDRRNSSAASVALNTGLISDASSIYLARFNSEDWSGNLVSRNINPNTGQITTEGWEAQESIPAWNQRNILTQSGATVNGGGTAFRWDNLSDAQKDWLRTGLTGTTAEINQAAQERLNYLRGDNSNEERRNGTLRDRTTTVLGDIINSAPGYVAAPGFPYPDTLENTSVTNNYAAFQTTYTERAAMVYVGANDGMLHGFNASNGEETLAYIPNAVYHNLYRLTDPDYGHNFFVDGAPTIGDAFIDPAGGSSKSWHTVLVGGLNKGGQAIYALDITDPSGFDEDHTSTVLWEFSDANDNDANGDGSNDNPPGEGQSEPADSMRYALGDTFSRPAIVRLANGKWAAVFGNGYNNTRADGHASNNGDAVLYILDLGTGAVIRKISTQTGSAEDPSAYEDANDTTVYRHRANGLATTAPIDSNADHIVDYVYAGDLFGNMWKFDLTSTNPADWGVAFEDNNSNPLPLFTACAGTCTSGLNDNHQPITSRPEVGRTRDRYGLMIYFGTGKYLANGDITDHSLQSFYGITDTGTRLVGNRSALLTEQTIDNETTAEFGGTSYDLRITSNNPVTGLGWFMDLAYPEDDLEGERVVQTPVLRNGRIIFPTLIPAEGVCGLGGSSWLMEINATTGARLSISPFDLDGDGDFTAADNATVNDTGIPASGKRHNEVISSPGILNARDKEFKYTSGSTGNISVTVESPDPSAFDRQSWRQLK